MRRDLQLVSPGALPSRDCQRLAQTRLGRFRTARIGMQQQLGAYLVQPGIEQRHSGCCRNINGVLDLP